MADNLKDILAHLSTEIDQETLLQYLQGTLSPERRHELEKQLVDNPFASDAIEGLKEFRDQQQITYMVEALNRDLKKKTERRRKRREKMKLPDQTWLYISIIIIIFLVVISYLVIHRSMQGK